MCNRKQDIAKTVDLFLWKSVDSLMNSLSKTNFCCVKIFFSDRFNIFFCTSAIQCYWIQNKTSLCICKCYVLQISEIYIIQNISTSWKVVKQNYITCHLDSYLYGLYCTIDKNMPKNDFSFILILCRD